MPTPQNILDLQNWLEGGLIAVGCWNVDGFNPNWHMEQARENRFVPTWKLIPLDKNSPSYIGSMGSLENDAFVRDNRLPISIRTENIATVFINMPRLPLVPESIPNSPLVWTLKDGVLNDEGRIDVFGPAWIWSRAGENWGRAAMVAELQKRFPEAPVILFAENNETAVDKSGLYVKTLRIPGTTTTLTDEYGVTVSGLLTVDELARVSLRVRDYIASGKTLDEFRKEFNLRQDTLYNSLYAGFDSSLEAWKGRLRSESYKVPVYQNDWDLESGNGQYSSQFNHYDVGGGGLYVNGTSENEPLRLADFTSTEWFKVYLGNAVHARAEKLNPRHIREVFLNLSPGGAFNAWQRGRHEVINHARYSAHIQWLLWAMKGNKSPVFLRYYVDNAFKKVDASGQPILDSKGKQGVELSTTNTPWCKTDTARKIVTDAGCPELATATETWPIDAANAAVNTILDNPILRRFWEYGKPICTGTHPANEFRFKVTHKNRVYPQPGDVDDGFRLLEIEGKDENGVDLNTPRDQWLIAPKSLPPLYQNNGRWNENARISIWGTAMELNGEYLVHLKSERKLSGTCKVTIPNVGTFDMPVPQPNLYRIVRRAGWVVEEIN